MQGVHVFVMQADVGAEDARARFVNDVLPRYQRPSHDSIPFESEYLTESEVETLKRRISAYIGECHQRRRREILGPKGQAGA